MMKGFLAINRKCLVKIIKKHKKLTFIFGHQPIQIEDLYKNTFVEVEQNKFTTIVDNFEMLYLQTFFLKETRK